MFEVYRKGQRKRIQTEDYSSHSYLLMPTEDSFQTYGPLVHCLETVQRPGTEIRRGPFRDTVLVTLPIAGMVEVSTPSTHPEMLVRGQVAQTVPKADEEVFFRTPEDQDARFLELGFHHPLESTFPENVSGEGISQGYPPSLACLALGPDPSEYFRLCFDGGIYRGLLRAGENLIFETVLERFLLLLVLEGTIRVEEERLLDADSLRAHRITQLPVFAQTRSRIVLIDLP